MQNPFQDDCSQYTIRSVFLHTIQSEAFEDLLKAMTAKPQECFITIGKVTTNAIEGIHGFLNTTVSKPTCCTLITATRPVSYGNVSQELDPIWKAICLHVSVIDEPIHILQ